MTRQIRSITQVSRGVHFVEGPDSNWTVLCGANEITLVDAGYPKDFPLVVESIRTISPRRQRLTSILVTHGHSDHIGSLGELVQLYGARVYADAAEIPNIARFELHQVSVLELLPILWKPRVLSWAARAMRAGGMDDVGFPGALRIRPGSRLQLSGHLIVPIPTSGHTPGHLAYYLPSQGILIAGDAVVTAHPTSSVAGLQMLPAVFHSKPEKALSALGSLTNIGARVILPGHGPLERALSSNAIEQVFERERVGQENLELPEL